MNTLRTIALRLDPETRQKLDAIAEATGYRHELLVAEAVRRFVDAELAAMALLQSAGAQAETGGKEEEQPPLPENWKIIV